VIVFDDVAELVSMVGFFLHPDLDFMQGLVLPTNG
jgi:hypothetical protein